MKVLVVGPGLNDPGGVANYYNAVFPRLQGGDIEAHYMEIGSTHGANTRFHLLLDQLRFWKSLGRLRPDVVHLNPSLDLKSYLRDGLFVIQAKLRGRRVLIFFRGWQEPFERQVSARLRWFFSASFKRADRFIVLARHFSDCLHDWGVTVPVELATTTVADELLDGFSISEKLAELGRAADIRLLYLARLEPEKGILLLLDAVRILLGNRVRLTLTIAGDGPAMEEVRSRVERTEVLRDRVNIAGYVRSRDKAQLFTSHHVFCFPTTYGEGMPNSVLEAMAFGMPVITCPVGGLADMFVDGAMGKLLQTPSQAALADAITGLVSDRDGMIRMAEYNFRYAQEHFLASIVAERLRTCYRTMLDV